MNDQTPTDEEYAAAVERDKTAAAEMQRTGAISRAATLNFIQTNREVLRLGALRTDLRQLLLDTIRVNIHPRGTLLATLVKHSYRSKAVVQGVLDEMVQAGVIRKDGNAYKEDQ